MDKWTMNWSSVDDHSEDESLRVATEFLKQSGVKFITATTNPEQRGLRSAQSCLIHIEESMGPMAGCR